MWQWAPNNFPTTLWFSANGVSHLYLCKPPYPHPKICFLSVSSTQQSALENSPTAHKPESLTINPKPNQSIVYTQKGGDRTWPHKQDLCPRFGIVAGLRSRLLLGVASYSSCNTHQKNTFVLHWPSLMPLPLSMSEKRPVQGGCNCWLLTLDSLDATTEVHKDLDFSVDVTTFSHCRLCKTPGLALRDSGSRGQCSGWGSSLNH